MKAKTPTDHELRKVFCEIMEGSTPSTFRDREFFVKHLGQRDQYYIEQNKESVYAKAKANGLPSEKEALETLIENEIWSQEEEDSIYEKDEYLKTLRETKKNLIIPSQIEGINKDIKEAETDVGKLKSKRSSMLTQTCEGYAEAKNNDYIVYFSLYKDERCTEHLYTEEEFGVFTKNEIADLVTAYTQSCDHLNISFIKHLAINPIFGLYYNLTGPENIYDFFKCPLFDLTFYQLNLLNYGKVLNSILANVEGIPEAIKTDPDDLLDYAESKRKNKDMVDKSKDKQGFSVMGATKKDMDEMGVSDETTVSPFDLAKKKGSLTLEDFQNFS